MRLLLILLLFKQCMLRPVVNHKGLVVTGVSMHRLSLTDTISPNRIYYWVEYEGYIEQYLTFEAFFRSRVPARTTPLNDIEGISVFDSAYHEMSDSLHFYKGDFHFRSVNAPDSELYLGAREKNMKERNVRMKQKDYFSVEDFAFYVDKSAPQPYEIRMRLDSCEVRSRVKKDTMRWMFR